MVAEASYKQGYNRSRLRRLTDDEATYIRGTSDFFALNHYDIDFVYRNESLKGMFEVPSEEDDSYYAIYKNANPKNRSLELVVRMPKKHFV